MANSTDEESAATTAASVPQASNQQSSSNSAGLEISLYNLRFACHDNAAYHGERSSFFDTLHRSIMAIVVISSSATIVALGTAAGFEWLKAYMHWMPLIPLIVSTADLVISPGVKAQTHVTLRSRYYELLADIEEAAPTEENCKKWQAALHRAYAQEPPVTYRAVKALSYNSAVDTMWREEEASKKRLWVPLHHRMLRAFIPFHGASYSQINRSWRHQLGRWWTRGR